MRVLPRGGLGALFPLVVMLLLAMLTLWLSRTIVLGGSDNAPLPNNDPDYIVSQFKLTRLSDSGSPRYSLTAEKMVHLPQDDTSLLTRPLLRQLQVDRPELRIRSLRGVITAGGAVAHLHDNVEVFRAGEKPAAGRQGTEDLRVTTTYLRVIPDQDRADTPERVRIQQGASVLNGTGMDFDNRYRRFWLHSDIKASFEQRKNTAGLN